MLMGIAGTYEHDVTLKSFFFCCRIVNDKNSMAMYMTFFNNHPKYSVLF